MKNKKLKSKINEESGLCFTCVRGKVELGCLITGYIPKFDISYSAGFSPLWYKIEGKSNWIAWNIKDLITIEAGKRCWVKGAENGTDIYTLSLNDYNYFSFTLTEESGSAEEPEVAISGKLDSLIHNAFVSNNCFYKLFENCKYLTSAEGLELDEYTANDCYKEMFKDCVNLVKAPKKLPALILFDRCYENMFMNCKSLTDAPELLSDEAAPWCYKGMFCNCEKLKKAPTLNLTLFLNNCWGCFEFMFQGCKSLEDISFSKEEYRSNFSFDYRYFQDWVLEVPQGPGESHRKFHYKGTDETRGVSAIPVGWTVIKE